MTDEFHTYTHYYVNRKLKYIIYMGIYIPTSVLLLNSSDVTTFSCVITYYILSDRCYVYGNRSTGQQNVRFENFFLLKYIYNALVRLTLYYTV